MKRKSLLILLLLAAFAPWTTAQAQETLTVYDGTTTNSYVPIYGLNTDNGVKCEYVIPAAKLENMANGTISAMTIYLAKVSWNAGAINPSPSFTIFLKEVDNTTLTAFTGSSDAVVVFNNTIEITTSTTEDKEITINFTTEYEYQGGNLLVGFYQNGTSGYKSTPWYGESQDNNSAWYGYGSGSGSGAKFLPKTTFTYEPAQEGDCDKPETMVADPVTSETATLTWSGGSSTYNVEIKGGSYADWSPVLSNTTLLTTVVEGLTPNTAYQVRVQSVCDGSTPTSGYKTASFTTPMCDDMCAITYTLTDAYGDGWNNNKMEVRNHSTNELIATWTFSSGNSTTGTLSVCEGITLDFVYVASGNYQYENGWTITDINEEIISTHEGCGSSWDCDDPAAGIIATHTVNCTVPTCIKPTMNATATNIEVTEATVSWTAGNEGQEHWDVYYCTGTATAPTASTEPQVKYTSDNPLTLTGLQAAETYYVWVRGNCGTEEEPDYSDWSAAYCTFTTTEYCADIKVDYYTIEFTDYTSSGVTVSWTAAGGATQWRVQVYDLQTSPYELKDEQVVTAPTATIDGLQSQLGYQVDIAPYCEETDDYTPTVSKSFSTLDDCPSPTDLAANDVTASSASISWTNNGLTEFNLRYSCDNTVTWINKPNVTSPCTIDELPANTKIYVQVQGTCDATNDRWEEMTFFTTCEAYTVTKDDSYIQDFEMPVVTATYNTSNSDLIKVPSCWDNYHASATTDATQYYKPHLIKSDAGTSCNFSSPASQVLFFIGSGNGYAALPEFTNAINELQISFDWAVESKSYGTLTLGYITDEDNGTYNTFETIKEFKSSDATTAKTMQSSGSIYLNEVPAAATRLVLCWWYSSGWYCNIDNVVVSLMPTCMPVGTLADATEVKSTSAKLSWTLTDDTQDLWQVAYSPSPLGAGYTYVDATTNNGFLLEGLNPEILYYVKVRANCGSEDGYGEWSNEISFTTLGDCFTPYNIVANNITSVSADLTWTGESDSYNVRYKIQEEPLLYEDFESGEIPSTWNNDGNWTVGAGSYMTLSTAYEGTKNAKKGHVTSGYDYYLITPALDLSEVSAANLSFAYANPYYSSGYPDDIEGFGVYYRVDGGAWNELFYTEEEHRTWEFKTIALTGLAANYEIGFKMHDNYGGGTALDVVKVMPVDGESGWISAESNMDHGVALDELEAGKTYEVMVQSVCDATESDWSEVFTFTTLEDGNKVFVTEGNWNTATNWKPEGVPTLNDDVIIRANTTIPADCVALADEITIEGENTITIEDGGQLLHRNAGVKATMLKEVEPYTIADGIDNYILLASPMQSGLLAKDVENLLPTISDFNVDFYKFDNSQELEWVNLENENNFSLTNGEGYLYAHNYGTTTTLSFTHFLMNSTPEKAINLAYSADNENWAGWNLIGNPFPCNATVSNYDDPEANYNYYKVTAEGEFETAAGAVAPMEGIFVEATATGQRALFTRVVPGESSTAPTDGILNVNLMANEAATRNGNSRIDMARLRFGHGNNLSKLNLFRSNAIVFFPQNGKDYGVMYAEAQGEMPLHFKAEKNGTYTLGFTTEDVTFSYLHLIDNLTGTETDLLATPSYTFDARTTDYASRFRLVFSANGTNGDDETFAFISNGNIIINGEGTLQIIDVLGRQHCATELTTGNCQLSTANLSAGVYMLRLINGTNVKVQKIVVK